MMTAAHLKTRSPRALTHRGHTIVQAHPYVVAAAVTVGALAISALVNRHLAKNAEHDNPPAGQFLEVSGVRLHYVERGSGAPLVLLHGNGSMIQDFESSGLIDLAAKNYRVIVFDRPGFGHSDRPRIASGYYYPTLRSDVVALSAPAAPFVGDVLGHTLSPIVSRMMWPIFMAKIFGPRSVPKKFEGFPKEMALRPSQIRASAAESALMIPDAFHFHDEYANLKMPVVIVAGDEDRLIDIDAQSTRLHRDVPQSNFHRVPGTGHMIHQSATGVVMSAINEAAEAR
jgi:pimeloyl-ACP methyl ester carboxylesterase